MCRDGYNVECVVEGCENRVTCRDEMGLCKSHGMDAFWADDDEVDIVYPQVSFPTNTDREKLNQIRGLANTMLATAASYEVIGDEDKAREKTELAYVLLNIVDG